MNNERHINDTKSRHERPQDCNVAFESPYFSRGSTIKALISITEEIQWAPHFQKTDFENFKRRYKGEMLHCEASLLFLNTTG